MGEAVHANSFARWGEKLARECLVARNILIFSSLCFGSFP